MTEINSVKKHHYKDLAFYLSHSPFHVSTKEESEKFWYSKFDLWWDNNPAFNEKLVRGLILENNGKIVGFVGCIPSFFQLSGKQIIVFNETTWRVDKSFRGIESINLVFNLIDHTKDSLHFRYGGLDAAEKMQSWIGFKSIFSEENDNSFYFIINLRNVISKKFPNLLSSKLLYKILNQIIYPFQYIINRSINNSREYYDVRIIEEADNSFDELWDSTKTKFSNTNVRTSKVLNWYFSNRGVRDNMILGCYKEKKLLGYFFCICDRESVLKRITMVDLWGHFDDIQVIRSLLNKFIKYGKEHDYDIVILPIFHKDIKKFCKKYFFKRKSLPMRLKAKEEILNITKNSSFFSHLHGDNGLF